MACEMPTIAAFNCYPKFEDFFLVEESSLELKTYLQSKCKSGCVPHRTVGSVEKVHPFLCDMVSKDMDFTVKLFRGVVFNMEYDVKLPLVNVCCAVPEVIVMPSKSIYSNRMFLCCLDCVWITLMVHISEIEDIISIHSMPNHVLDRIGMLPRAQVLDANFNIDTDRFATEIIMSLNQMFKSELAQGIIDTSRLIGLVLQFVSIVKDPNVWAVSSFIYQVLLNCRVASSLIVSAIRNLDDYIERCAAWFRPTAQSFSGDHISDIGAIVVTIMSVAGLSMLPAKSLVMDAIKVAGLLGRGIGGMNSSVDAISKFIINIMDWCYVRLFGVPRNGEMYGVIEKDVMNFIQSVNDVCATDSSGDLRDDHELRDRIRDVRSDGHDLQRKLTAMKIDVRGLGYFSQFVNRIDKLAEKADIHCISGDGPRPEPVVVQFFGPSGCGKSHVPYFIACDLINDMGYKGDPIDYMYYRNVEQEFFDGYSARKKIVVYDDFGQRKDTTAVPNPEFMELIRSGNIAAWPLHMANLSEKANTYFKSKAIILTSNKVNYKVDSLTHDEAFVRRIDLRFEVLVDKKYTDQFGVVDEDKVKSYLGVDCSEEIYKFKPYIRVKKGIYNDFIPETEVVNGVTSDVYLNYEQMCKRLLDAFHKRQHHGIARLDAIQRHKKKLEARAQVQLSQAEEFLASFWRTGGCNERYYKASDDLRNKLMFAAEESDNIYDFISLCLASKYDLKFKVIESDPMADNAFMWLSGFTRDQSALQTETVLSSIKRNMEKVISSSWFKGILMTFGVVAAIGAAYKFLGWIKRPFSEGFNSGDEITKKLGRVRVESDNIAKKPEVESNEIHDHILPRIRVEHNPQAEISPVKFIGPVSQAYVDSNANEVIQNVLACNIYRIGGANHNFAANIIFIAGRIAMCNWHVYDFLAQYEEISIKNPYIQRGYNLKYQDLVAYRICSADGEFKDAVLLQFPSFIVTHKNMLKQFVESKDISDFKSTRGILVGVCSAAREKLLARVQPLEKISAIDSLKYYYSDRNKVDQALVLRKGYKYQSQTAAGDCGSLLLINDPAIPRKICGIHVAGIIGGGYAISITREDLVRTLSNVPFESRIGFTLPASAQCEVRSECALNGEFIIYGKNDVIGSCPTKTDIFPSVLNGKISEVKCAPSVLKPIEVDGVVVDPLLQGVEKCGEPHILLDQTLIDTACDDLLPVLLKGADICHQRVLTYEEAIMGTNDVYVAPINRRSSAGYGWSDRTDGHIGKTKWLGSDDYILDNEELKTAVSLREAEALIGNRVPHLWVDTLKVERRPLEKVRDAKTRVFSVGQMDYVILCRKYFLGFCAHIMHNRIDNEIAVGINPYSYEWTYAANRQQSVGGKCISADFKNYDGCLLKQILMKVFDIYIEFMQMNRENIGIPWDDFVKIATVLFDEMVSSIHLCKDVVYGWTHSNPSGNPLTTIINCIYALILIRVCYIELVGTIVSFRKNVKALQYGDDQHLGVSDEVIDKFNQHTLTKVMKKFGMVYTDEHKSDDPPLWRDISETTFLKRGFIERNGRYDAPLCLDTCLEMLSWVRGTTDIEELTVNNVETSCMELSLHDKSVFQKWVSKIKNACYKENLFPTFYSYETYRHMLFLGQVAGGRAVIIDHDGFSQRNSE